MAHYVQCLYCNKRYDRDKVPSIQIGRRYAHQTCAQARTEQETQEEKDRIALEEYIKKLFNINYLDIKINQQIKTYINEQNYTYSGILKTLKYWYEVKGNTTEKANGGIGIVPFVYRQAHDYYLNLWLLQQKNSDKEIENYKPKVRTVVIKVPKREPKKRRIFTFLDEEEE